MFRKALELHGGNSAVYSNMAGLHADRNDDESVVEFQKKATRRDPKNSKHWTGLGEAYASLKKWKVVYITISTC